MTLTPPRGSGRAGAPDAAPFASGELPPPAVAWLHPWQLVRTGYHAVVSAVATGFLDRREMLAALEAVDLPTTRNDHDHSHGSLVRAKTSSGRSVLVLADAAKKDLWLDFVADIGDSWNATYATTVMLAQPKLQVRGHGELSGADIVVLGGDMVYPTPTRERYAKRMRSAFIAALQEPPERAPSVLAIPGNHDWYDGLTSFVRQFCQGGLLGGWRLVQSRSYFAAKLIRGWWIWRIDIALDTRIDAPQQAYFLDILHGGDGEADFNPGDRIILCTAKPVWLNDPKHSQEAYLNLRQFLAVVEDHGRRVHVILSGDLHHYSRFASTAGDQLIVAGGGGAYLTGTHHLPAQVPALRVPSIDPNARVNAPQNADDACFRAGACPYPSPPDSRRLALGALLLTLRTANWPFALVAGVFAWLLAWPLRDRAAALFVGPLAQLPRRLLTLLESTSLRVAWTALAIAFLCVTFAMAANRGSRILRAAWGLLHGASHIVLAILLAKFVATDSWLFTWVMAVPWPFSAAPLVLSILLVLMAAPCGATLFGVYLVISDRLWRWHRDEVFSVQSLIDYRNFLRLNIDDTGRLSIFPIGLRRVPRRWRTRASLEGVKPGGPRRQPGPPQAAAQTAPLYQPGDALIEPHLIEPPIIVLPG